MQTNESRYCTCLFGFEEEVKSSYCSGFFLKQSNFKVIFSLTCSLEGQLYCGIGLIDYLFYYSCSD
ncbi:hypothetical protein RchiOBHm_Chr7g0234101 [Rosa chinensis]|uniref:Uncharacterized protein n=1 Tax=Rosa chinensis TaxID=74649 RepID=A0A2P6PGD6_ROSCH|nr:hypothetical protein RchiOBHm_Chr7g0234101 [Rosa chinensis]